MPPPKPSTLKIASPDFDEPKATDSAVPEPAPTVGLATPGTDQPAGASSQPLPKATVQIQQARAHANTRQRGVTRCYPPLVSRILKRLLLRERKALLPSYLLLLLLLRLSCSEFNLAQPIFGSMMRPTKAQAGAGFLIKLRNAHAIFYT